MSKTAKQSKAKTQNEKRGPEGAKWVFPSYPPCPRCGSRQTERLTDYKAVDGTIRQYRICQVAVCRFRFSVAGQIVRGKTTETTEKTENTENNNIERTGKI